MLGVSPGISEHDASCGFGLIQHCSWYGVLDEKASVTDSVRHTASCSKSQTDVTATPITWNRAFLQRNVLCPKFKCINYHSFSAKTMVTFESLFRVNDNDDTECDCCTCRYKNVFAKTEVRGGDTWYFSILQKNSSKQVKYLFSFIIIVILPFRNVIYIYKCMCE